MLRGCWCLHDQHDSTHTINISLGRKCRENCIKIKKSTQQLIPCRDIGQVLQLNSRQRRREVILSCHYTLLAYKTEMKYWRWTLQRFVSCILLQAWSRRSKYFTISKYLNEWIFSDFIETNGNDVVVSMSTFYRSDRGSNPGRRDEISTQRVILMRSGNGYQFKYWDQIVEIQGKWVAPSPLVWLQEI